ncbi:type III-B CRISPR-associated protein Cas10/Cmr2 [bacterium]|nr:type III-B CRISPR-associated protein Cas10/Cmr2 [bacterium]
MPKSSITGELDGIVRPGRYGAKPGEQLSGVDLLKRHGNAGDSARFFSTSHVASLPFLVGLEQRLQKLNDDKQQDTIKQAQDVRESWHTYINELKRLQLDIETVRVPNSKQHSLLENYDGSMLFEERLHEHTEDRDILTTAKKHLRAFLKQAAELGITQPSPYYALLQADGDSMGEVIDALAHEANGMERHRNLSLALDNFAEQARGIVKDHEGMPIYIGGDDVLALVPLHRVLECADALAQAFHDTLKDFNYKGAHTPTLSVGVAVVHHLSSLTDSLDTVRAAEQAAKDAEKATKNVPGKHGLSITISRRSGGDYHATGKRTELVPRLKRFSDMVHNQMLPSGAAYELRDLALRLKLPSNGSTLERSLLLNLQQKEAERIINRKRTPDGRLIAEETRQSILDELNKLFEAHTRDNGDPPRDNGDPLMQLSNELIVASTFAQARRLAGCDTYILQQKDA